MSVLVTVAWRNLWRHRRRSLITATAMAVAVAMCMAMIAFTDGFYAKFFDILVSRQLGHVQVHHPEYPTARRLADTLVGAEALLTSLEEVEGTRAVAGRLVGQALVGGAETTQGAQLEGVDPRREVAVSQLDQRVVAGRFLGPEPAREIVLGVGLAEELAVVPGDEVVGFTQSADGSLGNDLYTVVGLSSSGNALMDKGGAWLHLADLQELLVLPDQVHRITVLTTRPDDLDRYAADLRQRMPPEVQVQTWAQVSPQTVQMMGMQAFGSWLMLSIVFAVASFGVLNTMMMSVFERTRELGVLKAIGLSPARMVVMILVESVFLALLSGAIGLFLGGLLDLWVVWGGFDMSGGTGRGMSFMGVQLDPVVYGEVTPFSVLAPLVSLIVVSVLASLWPAVRAARLVPVEAIRSQ